MDEWTWYLQGYLGGVENRVLGEKRRMIEGEGDSDIGIRREEVYREIARLKGNKATGEDVIENEALRVTGGEAGNVEGL